MRGTPKTDDTIQPSTVRSCTVCWPTEIAEQLYAHSDTTRFIAKLHPTADVEQLTNICASYHQIGARGS